MPFSSSSASYAFLSLCLNRNKCNSAEVRPFIEGASWNWEAVIRLAAEEDILPAICCRLEETGLINELPAEIADFSKTLHGLSLERNREILAEFGHVASLLNSVGIEPVALKGGAYLLDDVFADVSARYLLDIDLLVPAPELAKAVKVLRLHDYREAERRHPHGATHYPMLRRETGVGVELHHRVAVGDWSAVLSSAEVLKYSTPTNFQHARLRVPSPEHLVTHHFLHTQVQDRSRGGYDNRIWPSLRVLYDLQKLNERYGARADWAKVQHRFKRVGRGSVFERHLLIALQVLGMEPPVPIKLKGFGWGWYRTRILRAHPWVRHIDPLYQFLFTAIPYVYRHSHKIVLKSHGVEAEFQPIS